MNKITCSLQKSCMSIEDITRIRIASGKTVRKKRYLSVKLCVCRKIIQNHEYVLPRVPEIFCYRHSHVRRKINKAWRIMRAGSNNTNLTENSFIFKKFLKLFNIAFFLADSSIYSNCSALYLIFNCCLKQ